jgi:hypothetical protein
MQKLKSVPRQALERRFQLLAGLASFLFITSGILGFGHEAHAALSPLSLSILAPVQFPPEDFSVTGARLSIIWGKHRNVYGFDIGGIGNITEHTFLGVAVAGGFNLTEGETTIIALQAAGITNYNSGKLNLYGVEVAGLFNATEGEGHGVGIMIAPLANWAPHSDFIGIQAGIFNKTHMMTGFQIGLVNETEILHGLQIGLVNFNKQGLFSVSPLLNFGF